MESRCRTCPNKGKDVCIGYIEPGSHCSVCRPCRGNTHCTVSVPCKNCNARVLRAQAEVKVRVATAPNGREASGPSGRTTPSKGTGSSRPVCKRTRSKTPTMLVSDNNIPNDTVRVRDRDNSSDANDDNGNDASNENETEDSEETSSSAPSDEAAPEGPKDATSGEDPEVGSDSPPEVGPLRRNEEIPPVIYPVKDEDVVEIPVPVLKPTHTFWLGSSIEDNPANGENPVPEENQAPVSPVSESPIPKKSPKKRKSPAKKKKKVKFASMPVPSAGILSFPDGSMASMPADWLAKIAAAAEKYDRSQENALPEFGGTGRVDARASKTSGGFLETPLAVSSPIVPSNTPSQVTMSQPTPGPSKETSRRTHQDKGTAPSPSERPKTSTHRVPYVLGYQGGARSKATGHRSGADLHDHTVVDIVSDDEVDGRDNTFSAGEGGYSDDEDDEDIDADEEESPETEEAEPSTGEDYPDDKIDFSGVVQLIRSACNIPEVHISRPNNRVGYERMKRPDPSPRVSILLPWSGSVKDKRTRVSELIGKGRLDVERGSRLFKPPNAKQMRFYQPEGASAKPAELSSSMAEYLNEDLDSARKIGTHFNPIETENMEKMVINSTAALSWLELALRALTPIQNKIRGELGYQLDQILTCSSRAVGFVLDNMVAMGANWELKKRDSILEKLRNKEVRTTRRKLRNSTLFQEDLFEDKLVQDILDKLLAKLRDEQLIRASGHQSSKRQFSQGNQGSQGNKKFKSFQSFRGSKRGGYQGNQGRPQQQQEQYQDQGSDERGSQGGSNRGGKRSSGGRKRSHKKKGFGNKKN